MSVRIAAYLHGRSTRLGFFERQVSHWCPDDMAEGSTGVPLWWTRAPKTGYAFLRPGWLLAPYPLAFRHGLSHFLRL